MVKNSCPFLEPSFTSGGSLCTTPWHPIWADSVRSHPKYQAEEQHPIFPYQIQRSHLNHKSHTVTPYPYSVTGLYSALYSSSRISSDEATWCGIWIYGCWLILANTYIATIPNFFFFQPESIMGARAHHSCPKRFLRSVKAAQCI